MPTQPFPHSSFSTREGKKTRRKKLMGKDGDREFAYQLPSQAKQTQLGEN